jgi:hypothetical protein
VDNEEMKELIKGGVTSLSGLEMIEESALKTLTPKEREEAEKLLLKIERMKPSVSAFPAEDTPTK